jgi:hypothetical protein
MARLTWIRDKDMLAAPSWTSEHASMQLWHPEQRRLS